MIVHVWSPPLRYTLSGRPLAGAPIAELSEMSAAFAAAPASVVEQGVALAREAGLDALEDVTIETPFDMTVFVALIVEREAGFLECSEVAADGASGDLEFSRERVDRGAMTRGLQRMKQLPLADHFLVAGHGRILLGSEVNRLP